MFFCVILLMGDIMRKMYFKITLITTICIVIDLLSKLLIIKQGNVIFEKVLIKDFFSLNLTKNTGAAFSFLTGYPWIFIIIGLVVIVMLIRYLIYEKKLGNLEIIAYSLLLGGISGNFIDRIINGYVIDFLSFKIFGYYFPVFNFADTFIVIGAIILVINMLRSEKNVNCSKKQ